MSETKVETMIIKISDSEIWKQCHQRGNKMSKIYEKLCHVLSRCITKTFTANEKIVTLGALRVLQATAATSEFLDENGPQNRNCAIHLKS